MAVPLNLYPKQVPIGELGQDGKVYLTDKFHRFFFEMIRRMGGPANDVLTDIASLTPTDSNIIVGDGSTWVAESGDTARTSLGLGTGDSPQFTAVNIGHATDTTLTRASAGVVAAEGSNLIKANGTVPLTADWDVGSFEVRAQTFESDVVTGTAPFTIASTTVSTNLNADMVDGKHEAAFVLVDGTRALTADWDAGSFEIRAQTFESDVVTGTAPFTIASTTVSTNLNADLLDGNHASAFALTENGVTNGDSHDHSGGDGAQIDHTTLSNIGTNTHSQIDTHISGTGTAVHGLGTMSTQNANNVSITGGTITGLTGVNCINDTANSFMTTGLTINQGADDNEILALKSSDVAHGMTTLAETDTYFKIQKLSATGGGIQAEAYRAGTGAMYLLGAHDTDTTTKSTAGSGAVRLVGALKSGTSVTNCGADANLVAILNNATTRFIFDAEGTLHSVGSSFTDQMGNGQIFQNETSNANMTAGITTKTNAANHVYTGKFDGLATGITTATVTDDVETDDFFNFAAIGSTGGVAMQVMGTSAVAGPFRLETYGGAPGTTDTSSSLGAANFFVAQHDGANALVDMAADSNAFAWGEITAAGARATRMLLKADDGELHLGNTTLVALDDHDDLDLITKVEEFRTEGQKMDFQTMKAQTGYDKLVEIGLLGRVTEEEWNSGVRPLVSAQRLIQLSYGEARQRQAKLEALMEVMEEKDPAFRAAYNAKIAGKGLAHLRR